MESFILTFSYLAIGVLLKTIRQIPKDFSTSLNLYVIHVALPSLVLSKVPEMEFQTELAFVAVLPWVMMAVSAAIVLVLSRLFKWNRATVGCLLLMVPLGNTSFLGIPMVSTFFGEQAIAYAMIYDQLGSFLALATYGTVVLALFAETSRDLLSVRETAIKIFTFPPFLALIAAFITHGAEYPGTLNLLLENLGQTLVPIVMVAVGFQLSPKLEPGTVMPLCMGLSIKLVAAPLIALAISRALGMDGEAVEVAVFEAGMPPMVSAGALAIMAGLAPQLTAALVGLGIPLSFLTLPILFKLL